MRLTSIFTTVAISAIILSNLVLAEVPKKFKVATIKKAVGYQTNLIATFNNNMRLCVNHLTSDKPTVSSSACSAAITDIESMNLTSEKVNYLKSLSYSNRAISKYLAGDNNGALTDLTSATLIDSNSITINNLALIKNISKNTELSQALKSSEHSD
ncbi:hypothetical protein [Litorilituus lipolyticus]|uniref:Uncharacterized protein n=1 Tax=Litorilituus lipolyticus TaxID=2491017 RepID=A0A502L8Y6_9GAMM|nr:hypothetical protein [Litorilituus lipolyticus]TPH18543.1 hypothetical protein EPA86_01945 [Litorilituus lipolyticus]